MTFSGTVEGMTDDRKLVVTRTIDAPAERVFDLLTLPERHQEFDGSGMVRSDDRSQRIQAVGDVFTMNMHHESQGGDYQRENHVVAFVPNKVVGWAPAKPGTEPMGWRWVYTLEPQGPDATDVTLEYSWEDLEDKRVLAMMPVVPKPALEESLNLLAAAVAS